MSPRTRILVAAGTLLALAGGYAAYWFIVAAKLDAGIDAWAATQRQAGLVLEYSRDPVHGFPLAFRSTFRSPHIAGLFAGRQFDWRGADVEAKVSPFDLRAIDLAAPGQHRLMLDGLENVIDAGALALRLDFGGEGTLRRLVARLGATTLRLPDGRTLTARSAGAEASLPDVPPKTDRDPTLRFSLTGEAVQLPKEVQLLTTDPLDNVALDGTVKGPIPSAAGLREALAGWRDQGGTVEVSAVKAGQATLSVAGSATIALDADLQPIVAANLAARGLGPTIDLLAQQKRIVPEEALKLQLFVHGAEREAPGGGKEVATGLTLQGGWLSWGPFKLAHIPSIDWP